ncbi:hypothetical protein V8F63_05015 [Brevundimonas sp. LF-1]|uniref:hypothetical protein n=1 Tax=Brevundimonas sp. LF-1 TaxID=3126100 RepID=UPI0030E1BF23
MARRGPPAASTDAAPDAAPDADDKRLWARVASTVTPPMRRKAARVTPGAVVPPEAELEAAAPPVARGAAGKKRTAALTPASAGRSTTPASVPRASNAAPPRPAPAPSQRPKSLSPAASAA